LFIFQQDIAQHVALEAVNFLTENISRYRLILKNSFKADSAVTL